MLKRENYNDLYAFLLVAQEKSFVKAAQKLGISSPALSKTIRLLEERLKLQLLARTTRSVSFTQAGEKLFRTAQHSFTQLDHQLAQLENYRQSPAGLVRINCSINVIQFILLPKLASFKQQYPDIQLELISDNRFVDIVAEGFDAGVRFGNMLSEEMIAIKISEENKMALVGSPDYFHQHGFPKTIQDLHQYQCLGYRLSKTGGLFEWEFNDKGITTKITPQGQWIFNDDIPTKLAAKLGLGLAYLPEELVNTEIANGELIRIFAEQSYVFPSFYLYYPHRNVSPSLRAVIECLKLN